MPDLSSVDPLHFDRLYTREYDPWRVKTSEYEREKYAATLDALPPGRYQRALEVGCSIGALTRQLAVSCDELLAVDVSPLATQRAEEYCDDLPWVQFATMDIRTAWPEGEFDLILFSEVLYYLGTEGITRAAAHSLRCLSPGGVVLLVNWLGSTSAPLNGDQAADALIAAARPRLIPVLQRRTEAYRLDLLR